MDFIHASVSRVVSTTLASGYAATSSAEKSAHGASATAWFHKNSQSLNPAREAQENEHCSSQGVYRTPTDRRASHCRIALHSFPQPNTSYPSHQPLYSFPIHEKWQHRKPRIPMAVCIATKSKSVVEQPDIRTDELMVDVRERPRHNTCIGTGCSITEGILSMLLTTIDDIAIGLKVYRGLQSTILYKRLLLKC